MSEKSIPRGQLRELDLTQKSRANYSLRPTTRAYIASVAAENGMSETDVIHAALGLLSQLGKMGVRDSLIIISAPNGIEERTLVALPLDVSRAAFSVEEYQALYGSSQTEGVQ